MKAKKLPSGNWRVLVYDYTDAAGKRHYKSFTDPDKNVAMFMANDYLSHHRGEAVATYADLTLKQAAERYVDSKEGVLSPSTVKEYRRIIKNDFERLMPMKLSKITPELVQVAISELSLRVAPKTARNRHGFLHSVISTYRPDFQFQTRLPQMVDADCVIPITAEVQLLLSVSNEFLRVPVLLASQGSLRRSEICALTPDDFTDLGVRVNKAAVEDELGNVVIKPPKTKAGDRFCPLPAGVIAEARAWKHFGIKPNALSGYFYRARNKVDIPPFPFHKLRHYWASELHAQGVPDQYICEAGGWETPEMLQRIYQHALRDHSNAMSIKIVDIFDKNFSCNTKCNTKIKSS